MELELNSITAKDQYSGTTIISDIPYGKSLKIETAPQGVEILDFPVPEGKIIESAKIEVILDVKDA